MRKYPLLILLGGLIVILGVGSFAYATRYSALPTVPSIPPSAGVHVIEETKDALKNELSEVQKQKNEELEEIEAAYDLPSGATFESNYDLSEISNQTDQTEGQSSLRSSGESINAEKVWYEPGYFKSDALVQWQCAWLKEAVLAQEAGSRNKRDEAVKRLLDFKSKPEIKMFPNYEDFLADNVYPLVKGNTKNARDFINSGYSCVHPISDK